MKNVFIITILSLPLFLFSQNETDIFMVDIESKTSVIDIASLKNISNNDGYDNQPSFIDNNTILYASSRNGQTDILKYEITTGKKTWISQTDGGEYSPIKIPNKSAVSAVRLETNGVQKLYSYNVKTGNSTILIDDIIVGYYVWFDSNTIVSSALENGGLSLYQSNISKNTHTKIDETIGRSLHKIPGTQLVSYISKTDKNWAIKSFNPKTGKTEFITNTLPNIEDMCWLDASTILMAKDDTLYKYDITKPSEWTKIVSFESANIGNISRITVSPDKKKLVLAAQNIEILEPKLENISWISGNWKGEAFGGITEENWSKPSAGSMMATFKLTVDNKVVFYEIEIIREVENSLILQLKHFNSDLKGWEEKDKTVDFKLKKITANKVVFEGMTFEKISTNEMNVYVDIKQNDGRIENVKFNYKK